MGTPKQNDSQKIASNARCILCGSDVEAVSSVDSADIVAAWSKRGVDISALDLTCSKINLTRCRHCHLEVWQPAFIGDGDFYAKLSRQPWYYRESKWEYEVALSDINPGDKVLEIGCGRGAFLRLIDRNKVQAGGIEISESAVAEAKGAGLDVRLGTIQDLIPTETGKYDVVCHFQVLEHVADPLGFLTNCLDLLKPDGRLLIATPNQGSFIRHAPGALLNMPPHHQSRWVARTYYVLAGIMNLKLLRIESEPLAKAHADWAVQCWVNSFFGVGIDDPLFVLQKPPFGLRLCLKLATIPGRMVLRRQALRSQFAGHSIYVAFMKP